MSDEIHVSVVEFSDRKHFQSQWYNPVADTKKTKSNGIRFKAKPEALQYQ